ncbi:DUF983 domain-containing protein [Sphingorhabdus sp. 109]|jgi:uncharacterized protein (DUF983 family)|uniref:DUF983 domain-containing protein n=1 Tax=Sphingorhabdus sp. 109 TaxID=2653173 RepID=UPI0012F3993D|nr:DUF983 domain-containing protein [Sphingorhabdus sp. 109]VWX58349.1 conserved hypothetical protein [Sphingorhabdus sp. 109]
MTDDENSKTRAIFMVGWKGHCPRCRQGRMFRTWLKIQDGCDICDLDYRFAAPDDGPAFFSLCFVAFPLLFFVVWLQVALELPAPLVFVIAIPLMGIGCLLPLRPIKGWLVASQYLNQSVEAGTEKLWSEIHTREDEAKRDTLDS